MVCSVCLACLAPVVLKELRVDKNHLGPAFQSFRALMVMVFQDGTETVAMAMIVGVKVEWYAWYAWYAWHVLHQLCQRNCEDDKNHLGPCSRVFGP